MGNRITNIFIKVSEPNKYTIDKIANDLYPGYAKIYNEEPWVSNFPFRIGVIMHEDGIEIEDRWNCSAIIEEQNDKSISKFYEYFNHPKIIMAYMSIDFNGACGLAIIEDGKLVRCRYSIPEEDDVRSDDIGPHLIEEQVFYEKLKDNDNFDSQKKMLTNQMYPSNRLVKHHYVDNGLICPLMKKYIGFDLWTNKERIWYQLEYKESTKRFVPNE